MVVEESELKRSLFARTGIRLGTGAAERACSRITWRVGVLDARG